jgi:hypothetical protein
MQVHWTERKQDDRTSVVVGDEQLRSRQRDRMLRTRMTNLILKNFGLSLEDWTGSKYILRDRKGSSLIVHDLGGIWPAAEKLAGRKLDPLDPILIEALPSQGVDGGAGS